MDSKNDAMRQFYFTKTHKPLKQSASEKKYIDVISTDFKSKSGFGNLSPIRKARHELVTLSPKSAKYITIGNESCSPKGKLSRAFNFDGSDIGELRARALTL